VHCPPPENVPFTFCPLHNGSRAKETVPLGVIALPEPLLSVTVALHVAGFPNGT
jgi:hypothetical protein